MADQDAQNDLLLWCLPVAKSGFVMKRPKPNIEDDEDSDQILYQQSPCIFAHTCLSSEYAISTNTSLTGWYT